MDAPGLGDHRSPVQAGGRHGRGLRRGFLAGWLSSDAGAQYVSLIRAAQDWGLRPSALILLEGGKKSAYTEWDYLIAEAFQIMQDERCQQCGYPKWICMNESEDIRFRIETEDCAAMKSKNDYENPTRGGRGKPKEIPAHRAVRPIVYTESKSDLLSFREPFYRDMAKKREAERSEEAS